MENWDGQDYLPHVFHKWVDNSSFFIGIEESRMNKIVALGHVAILPDGTAWLEALRVRSDFRNQGISKMIMSEQMKYALDLLKAGIITRIASCTYYKNTASIHLSSTNGFKQYGSYLILNWNPEEEREKSIKAEPWNPTWDEIQSLTYFQDTNRLIIQDFLIQQLTENWWLKTKEDLDFFIINGARGWINSKRVEPHCVILEPNKESIMDWLYYTYKNFGKDAGTVILPKISLVEELKKTNLIVWSDWVSDCLYFVYDP